MNRSLVEPSEMLSLYANHFGIEKEAAPRKVLEQVTQSFLNFPYENLTKIIRAFQEGNPSRARRQPHEVVQEHILYGTGGTCFSLTHALRRILQDLGWRAEPVLADRHYGPNTHCALLVWIEDRPHLVDPGFLITQPVALNTSEDQMLQTGYNQILLRPSESGEVLELHTLQNNNRKYRLTFKMNPVDEAEFQKAWEDSFAWDMMQYPLLCRFLKGKQYYLQDRLLQIRDIQGVRRNEVDADSIVTEISKSFGMKDSIVYQALQILKWG